MDGGFTDYTSNRILNCWFGGSGITPPTTLYVGLSTNLLTKASVGNSPQEPNDLYYNRIAVTNDSTRFPITSNGTKNNITTWTFNQPRKDWGFINGVFVADASGIGAGNMIAFYNLTNKTYVSSGDPSLTFPSGNFQHVFT